MQIKSEEPIIVTKKQNEYLLQLATGPKTTNDLMRSIMVSMATAGKIIAKVRDKGLIVSSRIPGTRGKVFEHTLVKPYSKLNIIIRNGTRNQTTEEEILYAAILRNAGLIGQRLAEQFRKVFPNRKPAAIKNNVMKARERRLCR
jgi:DNA-binding MarR family transcriptional regulator